MAGGDNEGSKGGGGLIGIVVVTLLSLGLGGAFGMFMDSAPASTEAGGDKKQKDQASKSEKEAGPAISSDSKVVALTPIVVNLAAPSGTWIRVETSVLLEGMEQGGKRLRRSSPRTSWPTSGRRRSTSSRDRAASRTCARTFSTGRPSVIMNTSRT